MKPNAKSAGVLQTERINDLAYILLGLQLRYRRILQRRFGVDQAGLDTMLHLAAHGETTPTSLAKELETSSAATSLLLNRLEDVGHLHRTPHPQDGRKVLIQAEQESIASIYKSIEPIRKSTEELLGPMTATERAAVIKFLEGFVLVYQEATEKGSH